MALTSEQSQQLYGTTSYTGWGEAEASQDAANKGLTGSSTSNSLYGAQLGQLDAKVDEYIDDLISQAQGDRAFIAKQLEYAYDQALGTDDKATADFLEKVSSKLEEKIGTIPYDYEKYTARELEDYALKTSRATETKDTALKRLAEDEKALQTGLDATKVIERRDQESELNRRGIIQGTREGASGLAGLFVGEKEADLASRQEALKRAISEQGQDINTTFGQTMETAGITKERNIQDLTDEARRSAEKSIYNRDIGLESANRDLEAQIKKLEQQRTLNKLSNPSYALTGA